MADDIVDALTSTSDDPLHEPDDPIVKQLYTRWRMAHDHSQDWRTEARHFYDLYAGDQWDADDRDNLKEKGKIPITFNRIAVIIDAVTGTEVNNRQEVRYIGRNIGDVQVNEVLSGAADWVRDECDAEDEESDAFQDLVICGMGWAETRVAYDVDPDGMVLIERTDPLEMFWDPGAKKKNLSDALWVMRIRKYSRAEAESRWPILTTAEGAANFSLTAPWHAYDDDAGDLKDHVYPQDAYEGGGSRANRSDDSRVYVAHYQWCEWEDFVRYREPQPQMPPQMPQQPEPQVQEMSLNEFEAIEQQAEAQGGLGALSIDFVKQRRRVWKQIFVAGDIVLDGSVPIAQGAPELGGGPLRGPSIRAMTGKRDRNNNTWAGLVKNIADPQKWSNKFLSQLLHIINTNAKGGMIAEDGVVDDHSELEESWARSEGITWVTDGAVAEGKMMPKPPPAVPPQLSQLLEFSISSIRDTGGVNLEILGLADRNQPGVLEYSRKQSGITILAIFFDALRRYRKEQGRVLLHFITNFISDNRLIRITDAKDGLEKYVPLTRQPETTQYDTIVDEAPTSPNQREKVFGVMMQILPSILQAGLPIPPDILDYLPIPSGLAAKWKMMITQGGEPSQEQQQQMQLMIQAAVADVMKTKSETARNLADVDLKEANAAKAEAEAGRSGAMEADALQRTALRPVELGMQQQQIDQTGLQQLQRTIQ